MSETSAPLAGLRVLDLSRVVSGPFATQLLSDLGAEIVRVEAVPSGGGGPVSDPSILSEEEAFSWGLSRNKRSVSLDLKSAKGRAVLHRLVAVSDVVFDNFRPGVMARLGLDHDSLCEHNPDIITCSLTGFGASGPWATMPAYDPIVQAMSGTMNFTKLDDAGPPVRWGIPIGDLFAGLFSAIGILGAVIHRDRTGLGQNVDISMLDVMLAMNTYRVPLSLTFGQEPKSAPFEGGQGTVPFGNFECSDGWLALGVSQRAWSAACTVIGRPELVDDSRFSTGIARHTHREQITAVFQEALRTRGVDLWQAEFLSAGIVAGKVTKIADVFDHPQVLAREMAVEVSDESGRTATIAGDPLGFGDSSKWRAPSRPGADSRAVLTRLLGYSEAELVELIDAGVVHAEPQPVGAPDDSSYEPVARTWIGKPTENLPRSRPLDGRVVLELNGDEPSKAFAAQILADLGARVIRVDRPVGQVIEPYPDDARESAFRCGLNRGKDSVVADLKTDEGLAFFRSLVPHADVVLDNYRPGVTKRLGIDADSLRDIKSDIIATSITGYGHTGPWSSYPAFDNAIQALGGGMSITVDHTQPGTPVRWGNPIGGLTGSLYAVIGTLAALRGGASTTRGRVDVSLLDAQVALLSYRVPQAVTLGREFFPEPRRGGSGALPFGVFKTSDDRWFVLGITQQFWKSFCESADAPEWISDPRFATELLRREHEGELNVLIEGALLKQTAAEWECRFYDRKLPGAVVVTIGEAFEHQQAKARAMSTTLPDEAHPDGVRVASSPIKFSATAPVPVSPAPAPGADTFRIAAEFGIGDADRDPNEPWQALAATDADAVGR